MGNGNQHSDVDKILQELKDKPRQPVSHDGGQSLDNILAELGMGERDSVFAMHTNRVEPARQEVSSVQAPVHINTAAEPPLSSRTPGSAKENVHGTKTFSTEKLRSAPPAEDSLAPTRMMEAIRLADISPTQKSGGERAQRNTIWDIEVESVSMQGRVGKAAALDRVDPQKYSGDSELMDYFAGGSGMPMSKKELKKAEKERKKRDASRRKLEIILEEVEDEDEQEELFSEERNQAEAPPPEDSYDAYSWDSQEPQGGREAAFSRFAQDSSERPPSQPLEDAYNSTPQKGASAFVPQETTGHFSAQLYAEQQDTSAAYTQAEYFVQDKDAFAFPAKEQRQTVFASGKPVSAKPKNTMFTAELQAEEMQEYMAAGKAQENQDGERDAHPSSGSSSQGFDSANKSLYVDDMVDDRFREFFSETVIVDRDAIERGRRMGEKKKGRKRPSQILTGEFMRLASQADEPEESFYDEEQEEGDYAEYKHPKDAPAIERSIQGLQNSLFWRFVANLVFGGVLLWMGLGAGGVLPLPGFMDAAKSPLTFAIVYLLVVVGMIILNFSTVAPGLVGLISEPTVDTAPALATVGALLQAVVVVVQLITSSPLNSTLFGGIAALLLALNALGKNIRARSILGNFRLTSAGVDHSAACVLDGGNNPTYEITKGLHEEDPALLVSRPTALVKGFMRQSFSPRWSDGVGRILGWVLFGVSLVAAIVTYVQSKQLFPAISAFAATLCMGAPLTSSLVSGLPSFLLQQAASKVGAVVPGWSAVEELGDVNIVMANSEDIFPPASTSLHGLRAFEMQNINSAILYAASIVVEGSDTLREIFLALINNKVESLYKVESLIQEPGCGFTAWVDGKRVVLGNRELLRKHDIEPPSVELEKQYTQSAEKRPLYLAVSGKLYGMFVLGYTADAEVQETLDSLVHSGVSLLVSSDDMNITSQLIEEVYQLPKGLVKVLGSRELELLEPLTGYLDESEGVMSHIGSFTSFIGGMRAAAGCASAERMGGILQLISVGFACILCIVLAFFGGLANISIFPLLLSQIAWSLVAVAVAFARKY